VTPVLALCALVFSAIYSGLETAVYVTSRLRVFVDVGRGMRAARRLERIVADLPTLVTVLLIANNLANYALAQFNQVLLRDVGIEHSVALGTLMVGAVTFVFGESLPKSAARRWREQALYRLSPVLLVTTGALAWLARPLVRLSMWLLGGRGERRGGADDALVHGAEEGFLTAFQVQVARGVLGLRERTVRDEARPLDRYPVARLGSDELRVPTEGHEYRALVLDASGERVIGWLPIARLYQGTARRPPARRACRPIARVGPRTTLEQAYAALTQTRSPFAVLGNPPAARVVHVEELRLHLLGKAAAGARGGP